MNYIKRERKKWKFWRENPYMDIRRERRRRNSKSAVRPNDKVKIVDSTLFVVAQQCVLVARKLRKKKLRTLEQTEYSGLINSWKYKRNDKAQSAK